MILGVSLKLYLDVARTREWARVVATIARGHAAVRSGAVRLFVLPSLPALPAVRDVLALTGVEVGAQDLHSVDRGPYTGAVSGTDLHDVGCRLVEVGHAERRHVFGETDEVVRDKLAAAFRNGLTPVLCVGEPVETTAEAAAAVCIDQLETALAGSSEVIDGAELIVAYEPEWAIGAASSASPEHVRAVVGELRRRLAGIDGLRSASVIYGGSAQRGTLASLGDGVDGLFLGRFAHDPAELARIIDEAAQVHAAAPIR